MALKLEVTTPQGTSAEYHRVVGLHLFVDDRLVRLGVKSYRDGEDRHEGEPPRHTPTYDVPWGSAAPLDLPTAYALLKALPDFAGAEDC
ncbi:hypothetical protein GBZ26_04070 [Azospirillum formosense]|uniref:Uncharacterized protein n=1 Tax=Azospirillum formosense TaxID=861533 RepID=A0ABX2KP45_9PROT|nr:hypothetical protein [Azospirillum formosense]MBY3755723.1 hypothetical protein [Azospirillum formosense]NUB18401.1 hypothetical protein [Azospirillum formosense]